MICHRDHKLLRQCKAYPCLNCKRFHWKARYKRGKNTYEMVVDACPQHDIHGLYLDIKLYEVPPAISRSAVRQMLIDLKSTLCNLLYL